MQDGSLDAALVDLHELDAWRIEHPGTRVAASGYLHSIGFNIGLVGLSTNRALLARVDEILSDPTSHGALSTIAEASGVTYVPPRTPEIAPHIPLAAFAGD